MTTPSRQQLRDWSAELTLEPLDPADQDETRYVALADAGRAAVDELLATIELALDSTTQLLSGPSGSGKTTELYRLRGELERAGFHAAIFNIGRYVNESSPIDITEFLIALALGAHDVLGAPEADRGPGFAGRLRRLIDRLKISVDVPGLSATMSRDGLEIGAMGASVEVDLQRELRSSKAVVAELRSKLTYHIGQLYEEVAAFLTTLLPADDPGQGSVLIVDGLEKLRGTSVNDVAVQESVQALCRTSGRAPARPRTLSPRRWQSCGMSSPAGSQSIRSSPTPGSSMRSSRRPGATCTTCSRCSVR
ncbi:MAG: hypothetical protein ACRDTA_06700 [Pseudonocardiaceae bacterium]